MAAGPRPMICWYVGCIARAVVLESMPVSSRHCAARVSKRVRTVSGPRSSAGVADMVSLLLRGDYTHDPTIALNRPRPISYFSPQLHDLQAVADGGVRGVEGGLVGPGVGT